MNNKPFASIVYDQEDDLLSILYLCSPFKNYQTFKQFKDDLNEDRFIRLLKGFELENSIESQFQNQKKSEEKEESEEKEAVWIKDVVSTLIMSGLDAHYALNEMNMCDLTMYIESHNKRLQKTMEKNRLWTYIGVSPYLPKNIRSPKDLVPFPWENENKEEIITDDDLEMYRQFRNSAKR